MYMAIKLLKYWYENQNIRMELETQNKNSEIALLRTPRYVTRVPVRPGQHDEQRPAFTAHGHTAADELNFSNRHLGFTGMATAKQLSCGGRGSGRSGVFRRPSPLRTGRAPFDASGSSSSNAYGETQHSHIKPQP